MPTEFDVGDVLVYPHHGTVTVNVIAPLPFSGSERLYVTLRTRGNTLTIKVPIEHLGLVGARKVMGPHEIEQITRILEGGPSEEPTNWSRRFKETERKMSTNDPLLIAEVVRNLHRRQAATSLSPGEKRILDRARRTLITELALALDISEEEGEELINDHLETC